MNVLERKLIEIQDYWLRSAKERAGESLRNVLEVLGELLYVEPGQFLFEFLQNTEDALMEAKRKGFFRVELYKDKVVASNNGKPFDEQDLDSLCSIKSKKEPGLGYKGFIGIGWKSVFKVSNNVEVHSADVSFKFDEGYWRTEEGKRLLEKYGLKSEEVLWQVTPIPIEPRALPQEETTRFVIHLSRRCGETELSFDEIARSLERFKPSILPFLDYVDKVEIVNKVMGKKKLIRSFIVWQDHFEDANIRCVRVEEITDSKNSTYHEFLVFENECVVPENVKMDQTTKKAKRDKVDKRRVAIAFSLDPTTGSLKPIEEEEFYGVYSFLPLYEVKTGLKFIIQADFIVHPGRGYVDPLALWNKWLMLCVAKLVRGAIKFLRRRYEKSYLAVFDYRELRGDAIFENLIRHIIIASVIDRELSDFEVLCYKNHKVGFNAIVKASDEVFELVKSGLLDEEELWGIYGTNVHILHPEFKLRERDITSLHKSRRILELPDLLSKDLLESKLKRGVDEAIKFLGEVYKRVREKGYEVPSDRRFVITSSNRVKVVKETYSAIFAPEIEKLCTKFPEVSKYLKTLDFVHEDFARSVGYEVLKWLGVREITLKELAQEVLSRKVSVRAQPPSREELPLITTLIKNSGFEPREPIWVVTEDRGISKSEEVYYPLKQLRNINGYEGFMKELGVKLLDLDAYLKYDRDEEGWREFFSKVKIRGVKTHYCSPLLPGPVLSEDYNEIINRLREVLEKTAIDKNVELVRFLKKLYEAGFKSPLRQSITLKLLTDEGKLIDSDKCYLHDDYGPRERWVKWRNEGFPIGPFVSPNYIDEPLSTSSWREFLTKMLGVKEGVNEETDEGKRIVEDFAMWFVERKLRSNEKYKSYKIIRKEEKGKGYDMVLIRDGEEIYVEVKGMRREWGEVSLVGQEPLMAMKHGDKYWLVVVKGIPNNPEVYILRNPLTCLLEGLKEKYFPLHIPIKLIEERGERL